MKLKLECVVDVMLMVLQMSKGRGLGGGAIEQGRTTRSCKLCNVYSYIMGI